MWRSRIVGQRGAAHKPFSMYSGIIVFRLPQANLQKTETSLSQQKGRRRGTRRTRRDINLDTSGFRRLSPHPPPPPPLPQMLPPLIRPIVKPSMAVAAFLEVDRYARSPLHLSLSVTACPVPRPPPSVLCFRLLLGRPSRRLSAAFLPVGGSAAPKADHHDENALEVLVDPLLVVKVFGYWHQFDCGVLRFIGPTVQGVEATVSEQQGSQLRKRVVFGLGIGLGAGGVVVTGGWVFTVAVAAAVFASAREYFELVRSRGIAAGMTPPPRYVSRVCSVICALMPMLTLPKKTLEGAFAGLTGCTLTAVLLSKILCWPTTLLSDLKRCSGAQVKRGRSALHSSRAMRISEVAWASRASA
ncbi:hypothetical protein GW17_00020831 [Ensete ventricosum]|nr:hypothetical protein GW17_00020831 [Ensete ventricosum]